MIHNIDIYDLFVSVVPLEGVLKARQTEQSFGTIWVGHATLAALNALNALVPSLGD